MSEEKLIQHTEKAVEIISNKKLNWKKRLGGFITEVLIIVFAITLSIYFHNWNEHRNEKKIVREFLEGIKKDILDSKEQIQNHFKFFKPTLDYYNEVWKQIKTNKLDKQYIDTNSALMRSKVYFLNTARSGRFESFKSAGNLRFIENADLLQELIKVYDIVIPFRSNIQKEIYDERDKTYHDIFYNEKAELDSTGLKILSIIDDNRVKKFFYRTSLSYQKVLEQNEIVIEGYDSLIESIDKELKK